VINDVKSKYNQKKLNHFLESQDMNKALEITTESYNDTEQDYLNHKKAIRVELHDDKTLIGDLENSIVEADVILQSLSDKARFSNKLEGERRRMIQDRSTLLRDLCDSENVKYRKKTSTLPSYLDPQIIQNPDGSKFENIASKIKGKLFSANGKLKHQSPESYKKRNLAINRASGVNTARNKSQKSFRQSMVNSSVDGFDKKFDHFRRLSNLDSNLQAMSNNHKSPQ
jgi:hypothetical protein